MRRQMLSPRRAIARRGAGLLALAVAVLTTSLAPATAAAAGHTICVALVVDFTPLNGNVDSGCTRVPSGATGYDVLRAGGHTFEICDNGIIGSIDGKPANGCQIKDNNHFWGYWHRKPGSRTWTFSSYGAGFYHPVEGSTEGWIWEDGSTSPPADVPYPTGCHSPPASASASPAASHAPVPRATRTPAGDPKPTASVAGAAPVSASPTPRSRRHGANRHRTSHPRASATSGDAVARSLSTAAPTATPAVAEPDATGGGTQKTTAAAAVAAAALLGAGAWWRSRRNDGQP